MPSAPREEIQRPGAGLRSTLGGPAFLPQAPSCPPARRACAITGQGSSLLDGIPEKPALAL